MKKNNFWVYALVSLMAVAVIGCSSDKSEAEQTKAAQQKTGAQQISADSIAAANKAKRGQDLVNQAAQLAEVYCNCTKRSAETARKECKEQVMGAVNQILATLKGDEKTAFENTYNKGTELCR